MQAITILYRFLRRLAEAGEWTETYCSVNCKLGCFRYHYSHEHESGYVSVGAFRITDYWGDYVVTLGTRRIASFYS